ncbi:MAG: SDR family oxidoreductase, partial [Nocardia sp.]|nr:SDR family oxidoreductase [Nocardia sp.]
LPTMLGQGSGRIVATSSMGGKGGVQNLGHYVATKWGVIGLVKTVAQEVGAHGITANVVCPGTVDTAMVHNQQTYELFLPGKENPTRDDVAPIFSAMNAIPAPWVESVDISNAMVFLCSDEARYITGETISVALGQNATNAG